MGAVPSPALDQSSAEYNGSEVIPWAPAELAAARGRPHLYQFSHGIESLKEQTSVSEASVARRGRERSGELSPAASSTGEPSPRETRGLFLADDLLGDRFPLCSRAGELRSHFGPSRESVRRETSSGA